MILKLFHLFQACDLKINIYIFLEDTCTEVIYSSLLLSRVSLRNAQTSIYFPSSTPLTGTIVVDGHELREEDLRLMYTFDQTSDMATQYEAHSDRQVIKKKH